MKNNRVLNFFLILPFICLFIPAVLLASDTLEEKMMKVSPGMNQEEIVLILGRPNAVVSPPDKGQAQRVELWTYAPANDSAKASGKLVSGSAEGETLGQILTARHQNGQTRSTLQQPRQNLSYQLMMIDGVLRRIERRLQAPS